MILALAAPVAVSGSDWSDPGLWLGLLTLTALEIVLGIDNIIFLSILAGKLPPHPIFESGADGHAIGMATRVPKYFGAGVWGGHHQIDFSD